VRRRPRRLAPILVAAAIAGGAFGVGYAVASGGAPHPKPRPFVQRVPVGFEAGPGFLPAPDWTVQGSTATSGNGTRIVAAFSPASRHPAWPQRLLPLQLPATGRIRAHVGAYAVDVTVTFRSTPSPGELVAAREELGRLVVPSCPAAVPTNGSGAGLFALRWLPSHYAGDASDLVGARASSTVGRKMLRYREAAADCGARVASRSVEVDVTLPRVAKVSASLSQLTYFVAKTTQGWVVWERAR
ncbi:MAG TPA: hypothetical protein VJQ85_03465, partial [Gaiellaceae bacterium]|nr:hypothetical protein [Gaiellaceae bacterium]